MSSNIPVITVTDENLDPQITEWKLALVGKFLLRNEPSWKINKNFHQWFGFRPLTIAGLENGFVLIKFKSEEALEKAWESGPWLFHDNDPFFLMPLTPDFDPNKTRIHKAPVWINLPYLKWQLWNEDVIGMIGGAVGKVLRFDLSNRDTNRFTDARVLVEIDLLQDRVPSVLVHLPDGSTCTQSIVYENIPGFCKKCVAFYHSIGFLDCPGCRGVNRRDHGTNLLKI